MKLYEILSSKVELTKGKGDANTQSWYLQLENHRIRFYVHWFGNHETCDFYFKDADGSVDVTGKGSEFKIFSAAKMILEEIIKDHNPSVISFEADKSGNNRNRHRLYRKFLERWTPPGYTFSEISDKHSANFFLKKKK